MPHVIRILRAFYGPSQLAKQFKVHRGGWSGDDEWEENSALQMMENIEEFQHSLKSVCMRTEAE